MLVSEASIATGSGQPAPDKPSNGDANVPRTGLLLMPPKGRQAIPIRKKASLLQDIREDYSLAESMAYGRHLHGENVSNVSDDELTVQAAHTPR